jgi:DNA-binding transcriptional regulator YiaG
MTGTRANAKQPGRPSQPDMPNIAAVLKDEIARIARKEVRAQTEDLKKVSAQQEEEPQGTPRRFSASRLAGQRSKLGLSAADFGALLGVSGQSIYKWEHGEARPRARQLESIAALRGVGKREAAARLEKLKSK